MERSSFTFTIFLLLLGLVKIIPSFHKLMHQTDLDFQRAVAIKASLIASGLVGIVGLFGERLATRYRLSLDAVRIAGGLVLLISALKIMFPSAQSSSSAASKPTALQLAISPVAMPIIVPPAGIAAILILVMLDDIGKLWLVGAAPGVWLRTHFHPACTFSRIASRRIQKLAPVGINGVGIERLNWHRCLGESTITDRPRTQRSSL